jgi:hypothetical protein
VREVTTSTTRKNKSELKREIEVKTRSLRWLGRTENSKTVL